MLLISNIVKFLTKTSDQRKRNIYNGASALIGWRSYRSMNKILLSTRVLVIAMLCIGCLSAQGSIAQESIAKKREDFKKIQKQIQAVAEKCMPATVCIQAGSGSGSGVIVSKEGLVLTAAHVVEGAPKTFTIVYPDGRRFKAKNLGSFGPRDAAMCQIIEGAPHPFVDVGTSGDLKIGDWVVALGHPGGFDGDRKTPVRIGHVVSQGNSLTTDCALIGGDSGGPSFDLQGRLIGIHSTISTASIAGNNDVPIDLFIEKWEFMRSGKSAGSYKQGMHGGGPPKQANSAPVLGLKLDVASGEDGIEVLEVVPHSPAAAAGFQKGDLIFAADGKAYASAQQLLNAIKEHKPGDQMVFKVGRGKEKIVLTAKLITRKEFRQRRNNAAADNNDNNDNDDNKAEDSQENSTPSDDRSDNCAIVYKFINAAPALDDENDEKKKRRSRIQELLERSRRNGGRLKLSKEELAELQGKLAKRMDKLGPASGGRANDAWVTNFVSVFQPTTATFADQTFKVIMNGRHIALATVVSENGLLVTKLSEIRGRSFEIEFAPLKRVTGEVVFASGELDLALVRAAQPVEFSFRPINLLKTLDDPRLGTLCSAVGSGGRPAGVGVVSVARRPMNSATKALMGVGVEAGKEGVKLTGIQKGGPAEQSGLQVGDLILMIDNLPVKTQEELSKIVKSHLPEEKLRVEIRRGKLELSLEVTLGSSQQTAGGNRQQATDGASTKLSKRRWSFLEAIQHDCHIHPKDCGGLLVDLDGKLIGINIARAGRIKSYAIPIKQVKRIVDECLQGGQNTTILESEQKE